MPLTAGTVAGQLMLRSPIMCHRLYPLAIAAAITIGISSCAAPSEPDWEAAQSEADSFTEAASAGGSFLGSGILRATQNAEAPFDGRGVTLTYPSEVRIDSISAACFGGGEVSFGVTVRTDSTWTGVAPIALTCDSEARTVPLAAPLDRINAISLNGGVEKGAGALIAAVVTGVTD